MVWILVIHFVITMSLIVLVTRWNVRRRKKRGSQESPDLCTNMATEEYRVKRKQMFSQYPEVDRFVTIKRTLFIILAIYLVVILFLNLLVFSGENLKPLYFLIFLVNCIWQTGMLGVVMSSNWKFATVLYLWVFYNIGVIANGLYQNSISFTAYLIYFVKLLQYKPVEVLTGCLALVYLLLLLLLAIWLTLVPKNRRLAEQQMQLVLAIHRANRCPNSDSDSITREDWNGYVSEPDD